MKLWLGPGNYFFTIVISLIFLMQFCCPSLWARPTVTSQAQKVVRGWLKTNARPLGAALGQQIEETETFTDDNGSPLYYVVYLQPSGFVIVPADDEVEPIIAFVANGTYDPSPYNPLGALVSRDVPGRIAATRGEQSSKSTGAQKRRRAGQRATLRRAKVKAREKWAQLNSYDEAPDKTQDKSASSISDVRVGPLVQSTWGQETIDNYIGGIICYSYYTPNNWPCGCVATAMAQLIRYHEHQPVYGVGWPYMGGNGSGGPYVWSNMPLQPDAGTITLTQLQAIGALCYDAAESIYTIYGQYGSSASLHDADPALISPFGYTNSIHGYNNSNDIGSGLTEMINPNLDADHPVLLGIDGPSGGHAVVCDGYGYLSSTLYHHLNMGWSGSDDAWYDLPIVNAYYYYNTINTCIYNIFTSGSGEIISGTVTDQGGAPISGVSIAATGGGTYYATTNEQGIYALVNVPSNTSFTVTASKSPWNFSSRSASTGRSQDNVKTSGNDWGVNFTGTISAGVVEFEKDVYLPPEPIVITLVDSDLVGSGSYDVVVTTSSGDEETVTLSENPSNSGRFTGSIATIQDSVTTEDGTIQVALGDTVIVTYDDADDGTGNPATVQDTATIPACIDTEDFETGDFSSFPWAYYGDAAWIVTSGDKNSGTYSARAGILDHGQYSWLDITLDCVAGNITFYRKVSSESDYDYLDFYIDDIWIQEWSGEVAWSQVSYPVSAGTRSFSWLYRKDWSVSNGSDTAWIDDIQFPIECIISPVAADDSISAYSEIAETIELQATDDGLPGPLTYIITSLPGHGTLEDPNSGLIIGATPYSLANNDSWVIYTSDTDYIGTDEFTFKANDGQGDSNIATVTIDVISSEISADINLDNLWMYQSVLDSKNSKLTATVSITLDPLENTGYTYEWEFILPDDVSTPPTITDGGTGNTLCTFAAPSCDQPDGLSDSGQPLTIKVTVTGADFGNTGTAEAQFGIALLGDVNNDKVVNIADRSIINAFWRLGAAGPYTFTDCNINCDTAVNVADRSIANAVWRGVLGQNRVTGPCPLR